MHLILVQQIFVLYVYQFKCQLLIYDIQIIQENQDQFLEGGI